MPSKKDFDAVMDEDIDEMIEKGETIKTSASQKGKTIANDVKTGVKSTARTAKRQADKTADSVRKSIKGK